MGRIVHLSHDDFAWRADANGPDVTVGQAPDPLTVHEAGDGRFRVGDLLAVAAVHGDVVWVAIGGEVWNVRVTVAGGQSPTAMPDQDALFPPMSATVVRILVRPGERVHTGDTLVVLEAMKMELPIQAPHDAIVGAVHCREGEMVRPGTPLVELGEP
jgi:biotin carboxyl carrier protein